MKFQLAAILICLAAISWGFSSEKEDPSKYMISTPELIKQGKEKYKTLCSACHGEKYDGVSPVAASLKPPPRNMLDPKLKWKTGKEPVDIYKTIVNGIKGTAMAPLGAALKEKERWALVHFINSLGGCKDQYTPITKNNLAENLKKVNAINAKK